ncbi:MAG: dTDP-4-dehydrorhamnose 3,5-epimerase [Methylophilaceae bacterium]
MKVIETNIPDVLVFEPTVFGDDRGFFYESFNDKVFQEATGEKINFVQDNHSKSVKNVLRGLHYQTENVQGKLVRVTQGEVFDVAVDLRRSSPTFGRWVGQRLSSENKNMMWVPPYFAHGFLVLSDTAEFLYKTTDFYSPAYEQSLKWDDPTVGVVWPMEGSTPALSEKDGDGLPFQDAPTFE